MKTLTKEEVKEQIFKIDKMYKKELIEYRTKIALAEIDDKARGFLYRAIDAVASRYDITTAVVEDGELRVGKI